jgi:hypothetical protein
MAACKGCDKALGADNWARSSVVKVETGPYFQTPRRTWHLEAPGVDAFMIGDQLFCRACYQAREQGRAGAAR